MGRQRKYTKKTLEDAVERYFKSISHRVTVTQDVPTGEFDKYGHPICEPEPVTNLLGEEMQRIKYEIPPTVGGLCEALGIHRSTWADYCDAEKHPEFSDTTARARGRMRAYLEEQVLTAKNPRGVIFELQNNYGYSEHHEVELGQGAVKAVTASAMSLDERRALLQQIAAEFGEGEDDEETDIDDTG